MHLARNHCLESGHGRQRLAVWGTMGFWLPAMGLIHVRRLAGWDSLRRHSHKAKPFLLSFGIPRHDVAMFDPPLHHADDGLAPDALGGLGQKQLAGLHYGQCAWADGECEGGWKILYK